MSDHPGDNGQALDLSWNARFGASGYRLSRGTSPGNYDYHVDLGVLTSYVDTDLIPGQTYYYALQAQYFEFYSGSHPSDLSVEANCAPVNQGTGADVGWAPAGADATVEAGGATVTFDEVTVPGALTVTPAAPTGDPPTGFRLLSTGWSVVPGTVSFAGEATIVFPCDPATLPPGVQEADLSIWHFENGVWKNATALPVDTVNHLITARVTSFSPFALGAPVTNRPPAITGIVATPLLVPLGTSVTLTGSFTDPDEGDAHSATWQWDKNHPATEPGVVVEPSPTSGQASLSYQDVVVYDPAGGFVTGGGWISSPLGAYTANPALTGSATFGFVAKYQKGASVPAGDTQFQFSVAGFTFKSTSYDWLVVAGAKAQFKGMGTINAQGSYAFMLTAVDGDLLGKGKADLFRIKIWDKTTGQIIYDNQAGAADTAEPTTGLGGGSIVVHK